MRKFRLLPVIMVSIALMMGITGCESTTQKPAKEETKKEETKEEDAAEENLYIIPECHMGGVLTVVAGFDVNRQLVASVDLR